jgi:hypothetical protein
MKKFAPLLTLAAVAALGAVLLVANSVTGPTQQTVAATAATPSSAAVVAVAPPAPPPPPTPPPPVVVEKAFAGRSSGNEVTVAVAVSNGRAVGYVCDGKRVEAWLEGTLVGDQLTLTGAKDSTLSGTVTDGAALGSVSVRGKQWPYAAQAVQAPAGLYEGRANVDGVAARIGWIVEGNGRVTGNGSVPGGAEPLPAPPFDPAAPNSITFSGAPVTVTMVGGDLVAPGR